MDRDATAIVVGPAAGSGGPRASPRRVSAGLALAAQDPSRLATVAEELTRSMPTAFFPTDVTRAGDVDALMSA
jgi:hypothetical protein